MKNDDSYDRSEISTPSVNNLLKSLSNLNPFRKTTQQLKFIRVYEKFDVVEKLSYKGKVLKEDKE